MSHRRRSFLAAVATAAAALGLGLATAAPAQAEVTATPAAWTPQITSTDSIVRKMVQCGDTMFAVGQFSEVTSGGTKYVRHNAFSFSATTGAVDAWDPNTDGEINSVAVSPDCSTAYLGGTFAMVGATKARNLIAVNTSTGAANASYLHTANGAVYTVALVNQAQQLLVGGAFTALNGGTTPYFASVSPVTGAPTSYLQAPVAGQVATDSRSLVYNQQLSPSGNHLLFEGTFTSVSGQRRQQVAELDLTAGSATLNPWYTTETLKPCAHKVAWYVRSAAWSPDEQTIYLVGTGGGSNVSTKFSAVCDAAAAFTASMPSTMKWVNMTGGDSLYAAAASTTDLYVGGHQRWLDNAGGRGSCVPGCVDRPGIGSIDTSTGKATAWNPTRDRGIGVQDMFITSAGLWVASDTYYGSALCGGQYHPGICFFPGTA